MARIIRWNPYRELNAMRESVDRVFDGNLANTTASWGNSGRWGLALDIAEAEDEYVITASLPGIKPEDIEITSNAKMLTIKAEIKEDKEEEGKKYYLRERRSGSFCRSVSLPAHVKADAIDAEYDAGILTLRLPKSAESKPRSIPVKNVEDSKMIDSGE